VALHDAIQAAGAADILFVAAAGNNDGSNNDTFPHYPSSYNNENILAVASTDHNDNLSYFSNIGPTTVDLGAPGSSIFSTLPGNGYGTSSGTSMATPHVAGVAALLLSVNDELSVAELKDYLMDHGDFLPALEGKCVSGKRLNAYNSLEQVPPPGPTFRLSADPPTHQTINQGQDATYTINVESVLGFSNLVDLSASSNPSNINGNITFNPPSVVFDDPISHPILQSTMRIETTTGHEARDYIITVTGDSDGITKTTTVSLTVIPENLTTVNYTNDTVISIPDNVPSGITSTIDVPDSLDVWGEIDCEVNITHRWIEDLIVKLISPVGTEAILHNMTGRFTSNIHETYHPTEFMNENSQGTWTLFVSDNLGYDLGTLDSWTLTICHLHPGRLDQLYRNRRRSGRRKPLS
jgi:subtilisin-like proprotein convertase family protein